MGSLYQRANRLLEMALAALPLEIITTTVPSRALWEQLQCHPTPRLAPPLSSPGSQCLQCDMMIYFPKESPSPLLSDLLKATFRPACEFDNVPSQDLDDNFPTVWQSSGPIRTATTWNLRGQSLPSIPPVSASRTCLHRPMNRNRPLPPLLDCEFNSVPSLNISTP